VAVRGGWVGGGGWRWWVSEWVVEKWAGKRVVGRWVRRWWWVVSECRQCSLCLCCGSGGLEESHREIHFSQAMAINNFDCRVGDRHKNRKKRKDSRKRKGDRHKRGGGRHQKRTKDDRHNSQRNDDAEAQQGGDNFYGSWGLW
jgi:hypothetical protein